jgi:adenosylcobyric acid synthase
MKKTHARCIMIQGTSSSVGKSLLVTALCRIYARRGFSVFPFKSQNMALNSFVTPDGYEIGRAQALQAVAAGRPAQVEMNPVLLKPEGNSRSQIVLMGRHWKTLSGGEYYTAKTELWDTVTTVLDRVCGENDLLIVEGAGSPAEINLKEHEIVNMKVAQYLESPVLLAADIDRGGVFAFLYGTLALLEPDERELICGFIINKFRGDIELLRPGLGMLADLTEGRPTLGVIPHLSNVALAQEDSVHLDEMTGASPAAVDIGVIRFPHISNYDDFDALMMEPDVSVRFITRTDELGSPSAIILPGTKTTPSDLQWLHESGLGAAVRRCARNGVPVVGICGGYQMLGTEVVDEGGIEGSRATVSGLGLLRLSTVFSMDKETVQRRARACSNTGFFATIQGCEVEGYEIHMGRTTGADTEHPVFVLGQGNFDGAVRADGQVWGTYLHGVFDMVELRRAWLSSLGRSTNAPGLALSDQREQELNRVADAVEQHMDMDALDRIIGL